MSRFLSLLVLIWGLSSQHAFGQLLVPLQTAAGKSGSGKSTAKCDISRPPKRCATAIEWYAPEDAAKLARHQSKLMMVMHLSGNFEKESFT